MQCLVEKKNKRVVLSQFHLLGVHSDILEVMFSYGPCKGVSQNIMYCNQ